MNKINDQGILIEALMGQFDQSSILGRQNYRKKLGALAKEKERIQKNVKMQ